MPDHKVRNETRLEYLKRINEVIDFIDRNMDQELPLEYLSQKAYFSSYHFHRIFSAIIGETLNAFVNRKRIERIASRLLIDTDKSMSDLAIRYGFDNANSFSRSFKKFYGITPTEFKKKMPQHISKIGIGLISLDQYLCIVSNIKKWLSMNAKVEIKELPEMKLAALTYIGEFEKTPQAFEKLLRFGTDKGLMNHPGFLVMTLYHDNPRISGLDKSRWSVGFTLDRDIEAEGEIRPFTVSKGKFAVGHFEILPEQFPKAWESMPVWVIENGYTFRDSDCLEIFYNDGKNHPEHKFIVDICIPIE